MAIRDWPLPARRALGYGITVLSVIAAFGPLILFASNGELWNTLHSSAQIFGAYAAIITALTAVISTACLAWALRRRIQPILVGYVLLGAIIGIVVGLILIPITVGVSLFISPAASIVTSVVMLGLRLVLRDRKTEEKSP